MTPQRPLDITSSPVMVGGSGAAWTTRTVRGRARLLAGETRLDRTAAALGQRLAALHSGPVDRSRMPAAPRPWPLREQDARRDTSLVSSAIAEPAVAAAVDSARGAWHAAGHLVHADLNPRSVVVRQTPVGPQVTLVDRGSVGVGHPAWDVVTALELLGDLDSRGRSHALAQQRFLAAYVSAGGPAGAPSPAWGCVRALVSAESYAVRGLTTAAHERLERARAAAANVALLTS